MKNALTTWVAVAGLLGAACGQPGPAALTQGTPIATATAPATPAASTPTASPTAAARPSPPAGFSVTRGELADVYAEQSIDPSDVARAARTSEAAVARIQLDYGRAFADRPTVYLFASEASFKAGLIGIWGLTEAAASSTAKNTGAGLPQYSVGLNWAIARPLTVLAPIFHELTHVMIEQLDPRRARMPVWLNEGSARLGELGLPGTDWRALEIRYTTISMATTNTLFPFKTLAGFDFLTSFDGLSVNAAYAQSGQMVQFLREDLSPSGVLRIIELIRQGQTFDSAYQNVAGRSFADFEAAFAQRAKALAPSSPGIATAPDAQKGRGPTYLLYGFPPSTPVNLTFSRLGGGSSSASYTTTVFGTFTNTLSNFPPGTHTITATGANGSASASVTIPPP